MGQESTLGAIAAGGGVTGVTGVTTKVRAAKVLRSAARTRLVEMETGRMQAVLSHPQFRANPIAAVSNHIVANLKKNAPAPHTKRAAGGKAGGKAGGRAVDVRVESDAVALATQRRSSEAGRRGIAFGGGGASAGRGLGGGAPGAGALGVRYSNAKKKQGAKKGSKRSKKRAKEEW